MKVKFQNAENILKGIGYVADDLGITVADGDADLVVSSETNCNSKSKEQQIFPLLLFF